MLLRLLLALLSLLALLALLAQQALQHCWLRLALRMLMRLALLIRTGDKDH